MQDNKEKGRIVRGGQGGFLNPPTHPEHNLHVETDLRRRPENRGSCSLSYAASCEYLDAYTRAAASRELSAWQRPDISSSEVQDWIHQVLGYFRGCYKGPQDEPECWNAGNLVIDQSRDPLAFDCVHAGVNFIRKYYPEFVPDRSHFDNAYWGTKPEAK